MDNLGKRREITDASISNRSNWIQEIEERISSIKDMKEETDISVKENVKSKKKKILTQNIQEIWDIRKRPNLRLIRIEGEGSIL